MTESSGYGSSRRAFIRGTAAAAALSASGGMPARRSAAADDPDPGAPIDLGTRRELFVDDLLMERLSGKADLRLQHPQPREQVLVHDAPWEGSGSGYHSVFQDGDLYRMYYKAWHLDVSPGKVRTDTHPLYC